MKRRKKKGGGSGFDLGKVGPWSRSGLAFLAAAALGLAGAAAFVTLSDVYQLEMQVATQTAPPVTVVFAGRTLNPGVKVQADDLFGLAIPGDLVVPGMVTDPKQIIGRYPREKILFNEVVRVDRIADPDRGQGLNAVLPRGTRALAVEISNAEALSGMLQPGSYVDIVATFFGDDREQPQTRTIAQGVFLLAVNENQVQLTPQEQREVRRMPRPAVTFLVSPEEAHLIVFADQVGTLQLAARNGLDNAYAQTSGADLTGLLEAYAPNEVVAAVVDDSRTLREQLRLDDPDDAMPPSLQHLSIR